MSRFVSVVLIGLVLAAACLTGCASHPPATIRVLTYNIHHGEGLDGVTDLDRIAQVIRRTEADLVALQEVDRGVERTDRIDQPAQLAELTGMRVVFEKNIDLQGGQYGNAVLSRFPITYHRNHRLPRLASNEQRGLLEVHVTIDGQRVIFFATHLDHQPDDGERLACVAVLQRLARQCSDDPVIVAGDLNAVPDSRVLHEVTTFLRDAFDAVGGEAEFTFPSGEPNRRIDYILYNHHPTLRCVDCRVIPQPVASDHRPVLAVFELRPAQSE
jgi:endonuclease/exonuclease/phosphatase family metal-dependent hydrolase